MKRLTLLLIVLSFKTLAQKGPVFKPLRYDEDCSFLQKDSVRSWYGRMKYSLSEGGKTYLNYGGEVRFQYFYIENEDWGDAADDRDGYVLSRYLFHTDFRAGKHLRAFAQLQSSMANGRIPTSPVEENPLELHQAFIDIIPSTSTKNRLTFRLGRQELSYGSQRLVSVREIPNNRQSFDAARAIFTSEKTKTELFYGHYVAARKGIFDDNFNKDTKLWGTYFTENQLPVIKNIDLYYFGLWKRRAAFNDGTGKEIRHSVGTRIWSNKDDWKYDIEALYQFGRFAGRDIAAWTASANTSYQFSSAKFRPELGLKTELISGDPRQGDNELNTFNPLFPKGAYFGLAALIGPSNLVDIHPSVSLDLTEKLTLDLDYDLFWRFQKNDGIYAVNVQPIYDDGNTPERHIGNQLTTALNYQTNPFFFIRAELTWFQSGNYLKTVSAGKDVLFAGITAQLKF